MYAKYVQYNAKDVSILQPIAHKLTTAPWDSSSTEQPIVVSRSVHKDITPTKHLDIARPVRVDVLLANQVTSSIARVANKIQIQVSISTKKSTLIIV